MTDDGPAYTDLPTAINFGWREFRRASDGLQKRENRSLYSRPFRSRIHPRHLPGVYEKTISGDPHIEFKT